MFLVVYFSIFPSLFFFLSHSVHLSWGRKKKKKIEFTLFVTSLKSSTVRNGSWLLETEPGPWGTPPVLWLPDALAGLGNATSTAAAGGGERLPTNCWQQRRAYLASASRKGLAAWIRCVRKLIRLRIMRQNKAPLSASHLLIFLLFCPTLCVFTGYLQIHFSIPGITSH